MGEVVEFGKFLKELFPDNPWVVLLALVGVALAWKFPELLTIWLGHRRDSKKLDAEIARQKKLTDVTIREKLAKIEDRAKRSGK